MNHLHRRPLGQRFTDAAVLAVAFPVALAAVAAYRRAPSRRPFTPTPLGQGQPNDFGRAAACLAWSGTPVTFDPAPEPQRERFTDRVLSVVAVVRYAPLALLLDRQERKAGAR